MKKLLFLLVFIPLVSLGQEKLYSYYANGQVEWEWSYNKDDNLNGITKKYYENGQLEQEWNYKDGKIIMEDGIHKEYYENGNVRIFRTWKDGVANGLVLSYCEESNEIVAFRATFVNGKTEGIFYHYYCRDSTGGGIPKPKGGLSSVSLYKNDKKLKTILDRSDGGTKFSPLKENDVELSYVILDDNLNIKKNMKKMSTYDIKSMINYFIDDCKKWGINIEQNNIKGVFEELEGDAIASSYASDNDNFIFIKVDPENWENSSIPKRWYILYHELGHDVLNLEHGEGGKMMFNFTEKDYTWVEFKIDKAEMFRTYKLLYQ